MTLQLLPGEFAIETFLKETFITAVGGGGRTSDVIHTDATTPSTWETFRLWYDPERLLNTPENPEGFFPYAIQTASGNYLTAVGGGDRISDVLHTDATEPRAWETFGLIPQVPPFSIYPVGYDLRHDAPWYYAIATEKGNYLTALGGGGHTQDPAVHTDATKVNTWELFRLICKGPLISGRQYALRPVPLFTLAAGNGGGEIYNGLLLSSSGNANSRQWAKFTLLQQPDGTYALQTLSGNYVTAVAGGGIGPLPQPNGLLADAFHTDATHVKSWEKFRILDQGDFTYVLQTVFDWYVGLVSKPDGTVSQSIFRTDLTDIKDAARWRLTPLLSEN
jgi:hypothetical protein